MTSQTTATPTEHVEAGATPGRWARAGMWALPIYGALTLWASRTSQPDYTTDFPAYARYISRPAFLWEHLVGSIGGTALALLGLTALFALLSAGHARRWALAGFVSSMAGNA